MSGTIIFSGPSLRADDKRCYAGLDFRPPAGAGDILQAVTARATRIALIDGVFADCMAVQHKEILFALSRGIAVYGAASMGALRAAELDVYGMIGVGEIYDSYHRGDLIEDEAVALVHGPEDSGYRALTLPTVDALATLEALVSRGRIGVSDAERLRRAVRRTHFSRRTWRSVVETEFRDDRTRRQILANLRRGQIERKRLDALMLLERLVADARCATDSRPDAPAPPMTPAFRALLAQVSKLQTGLA